MILLILWVKLMRGTNAANFRHHGCILVRRIPEKSPICASSPVDDVINRSRAQAKARLYMPMYH